MDLFFSPTPPVAELVLSAASVYDTLRERRERREVHPCVVIDSLKKKFVFLAISSQVPQIVAISLKV